MGCPFWVSEYNLYSAFEMAITYAIPCYIWPNHNTTSLYLGIFNTENKYIVTTSISYYDERYEGAPINVSKAATTWETEAHPLHQHCQGTFVDLCLHTDKQSRQVRSRKCGCLVTWFCYQLIAKPGNKTATPSWPDLDTLDLLNNLYIPNETEILSFWQNFHNWQHGKLSKYTSEITMLHVISWDNWLL